MSLLGARVLNQGPGRSTQGDVEEREALTAMWVALLE